MNDVLTDHTHMLDFDPQADSGKDGNKQSKTADHADGRHIFGRNIIIHNPLEKDRYQHGSG